MIFSEILSNNLSHASSSPSVTNGRDIRKHVHNPRGCGGKITLEQRISRNTPDSCSDSDAANDGAPIQRKKPTSYYSGSRSSNSTSSHSNMKKGLRQPECNKGQECKRGSGNIGNAARNQENSGTINNSSKATINSENYAVKSMRNNNDTYRDGANHKDSRNRRERVDRSESSIDKDRGDRRNITNHKMRTKDESSTKVNQQNKRSKSQTIATKMPSSSKTAIENLSNKDHESEQ